MIISLKEMLENLVKGIVQTEEDIQVNEEIGQVIHGKVTSHFTVKVKKEEFSLLVGKKGTTINALRVIMSKLGGKLKRMVFVDLDET